MASQLAKYVALGNDFLVGRGPDPGEVRARALCDRRRGPGADGLIMLEADAVSLRNADGSPAGFSGNGVRCAGYHRHLGGATPGAPGGHRLRFGDRDYRVRVEPADEASAEVTVEVTDPVRRRNRAPDELRRLAGERVDDPPPAFVVDVGNPHLVFLAPAARPPPAAALDWLRRGVPGFEGGVNVSWFRVDDDGGEVATYERGVGPTPACASAAMACFLVADGGRPPPGPRTLRFAGGDLTVSGDDRRLALGSAVRRVFDGRCYV